MIYFLSSQKYLCFFKVQEEKLQIPFLTKINFPCDSWTFSDGV